MNHVRRPLKIGLLWHSFRCPNLGVGALTIAHLSILNAVAHKIGRSLSFNIVGPTGSLCYSPNNISFAEVIFSELDQILPGSPIWQRISDCDIVFDSMGGDSFSDIYGEPRLAFMSAPKAMAMAMHKPLIMSPQTIGPFKSGWSQLLASQLCHSCTKIFTRDTASKEALAELGVRDIVDESVDVAFRLPFYPRESSPGRRTSLGFNVSGLLYAGGYTGDNQFGLKSDYPALINQLLTILKRRGISITLVAHVIGGVDDDVQVCRTLAEQFEIEMAPVFSSPSEAKTFISGFDIFIGSRMHATIAAISSNVPVIPLSYSRKFTGVFRSVNYPMIGDLIENNADEISTIVVDAIDRRLELGEISRLSNIIAQRKLDYYSDFIEQIFSSIP